MQLNLDANWARILRLTHELIIDSYGDRDIVAQYILLLNDLRHDRLAGGTTVLGLYRAPASRNRHHSFEGGLVEHLLQMWDLWDSGLKSIILASSGRHPLLDDRHIWRGILHHDLNKVWKYRLTNDDPWTVEYENDPLTRLLGDTHKSLWFLNKYSIKLTLPLHNALMTAEGGFSKGEYPSVETVLAKVLYLLDDFSANVIDRLQFDRFWDSKVGGLGAGSDA